jgi:rhodanese-related sulfurtransferase
MTPFPLPLTDLFGQFGAYLIYLLIGFAFGAVLEMSGFAISTKLAAQFYLKDMTVLKVMFTAIVVAMVLIFGASALGLLDYNLIWVNPTYLWPGIVGGLIMGVGFIVGGFCPGTSVVAAATFKLDGLFFVLGTFFGIFVFGETVGLFDEFFYSSYMGRFTLPQLFGVDTGVVVLGVVIMALLAFAFAELMERIFGKQDPRRAPKWRFGAAGGLALLGAAVLFIGQPTSDDRWNSIAPEKDPLLARHAVQIHPGELRDLIYNDRINLVMLDVRAEADYNLFHLLDAEHVPIDQLAARIPAMQLEPANTVFVLMGNDEGTAIKAWQLLTAESVPNVYILGGGVNGWIQTFADETFLAAHPSIVGPFDTLRYRFDAALGANYAIAYPEAKHPELTYVSKVVLKSKRGTSGGCG